MPLVARASKTVRNKNIIIVVMCVAFLAWFAYDGYHTYPTNNDHIVEKVKADANVASQNVIPLQAWNGWEDESAEHRLRMDQIIKDESAHIHIEGWKNVFDINLQRYIVWGLGLAVGGAIWWFIHCQRRRAIAEETTISPAPGIVIPWDKITVVDNTRWKSHGIVDITYLDEQGSAKRAKFDDYELDREPLLGILDQLAERATKAEFIPKDEAAPAPASQESREPPQNA